MAALIAIGWPLRFADMIPRALPRVLVMAGIETGIVMLLIGDSAILAKALFFDRFGQTL